MIDGLLVNNLLPVIVVITAFGVISSYLTIKLPWSYKLKLIIIPLLIASSFFLIQWFSSRLGYAVHTYPSEKFAVISFRPVVSKESEEKKIELWVVLKNGKSRLYSIPWSQKMEDELRKGTKDGQPLLGEPRPKTSKDGGKSGYRMLPEEYLMFYKFQHEIIAPKDEYRELRESAQQLHNPPQ